MDRDEEIKELKAAAKYIVQRLDALAPEDKDDQRKPDVEALRKKYTALRRR